MADSHQMFIDGEWVNSSTDETRDMISPHTGEVLATVQEGTAEDADRAVAAAKKAFDGIGSTRRRRTGSWRCSSSPTRSNARRRDREDRVRERRQAR